MDIIKVNECLWHGYRPPLKGIFNNEDIGKAEGEEQDPQEAELSLKEQAKAHLAAAVAAEAAAQEDAAADKEALAEEALSTTVRRRMRNERAARQRGGFLISIKV